MENMTGKLACTFGYACQFSDSLSLDEHTIYLFEVHIMERFHLTKAELKQSIREILNAGIDVKLWNSFGCQFTKDEWETFLKDSLLYFE